MIKTNKIFMKSIALLLCLALVIVNVNVKEVKADTIQNSSFESEQIISVFNTNIVNNPEVSGIDKLAKEYYNQFIKSGITREMIMRMTYSDPSQLSKLITPPPSNADVVKSSGVNAQTLDYSALMQQVTGYTYTTNQIAAQLASIGIVMNLSNALPFLDLLALVAGASILVISIAIAYSAIAVGVNDLILTWYAYSGVNLTAARANTQAIVTQSNNGAKYWKAYLANYEGLGGIYISDPVTLSEAQIVVTKNMSTLNIFAMYYSDAALLATSSYGIGFTSPEAHRENGKVLNMQHIHALLSGGIHGLSHIFFALPAIA